MNKNFDNMTFEEMKEEFKRLENRVRELEGENYIYEDASRIYRKGLVEQIVNDELDMNNPIEVLADEFCKIYNECMDKYFEMEDQAINEEKREHIMDSYFYLNWNGIKCKFINGAAVSNEFIPGLQDTCEELYG